MSSTYSAGSAALVLALNGRGCSPLHSAKLMHAHPLSCKSTGPMSGTTVMCEPHLSEEDLPMSSAAGSHAKTLVEQEGKRGSAAIDLDCGQSMPGSLATFDRNSSSWKTSQLCLDGELAEFSETWPRSGMMRSGSAYRRRQSVIRILETECGLLPTPTVKGNYNRVGASATSGDGLATKVRRLTGYYPAAEFCEVMMGFPQGWTVLPDAGMQSFRKSRKQSAEK